MNLFLESFKKKQNKTPIWFMRQAGRYLPQYQKVRAKYTDFMEFCNAVEDIVEVTLQPIKQFDLDAAIIFSDILVIPQALGYKVEFTKDHGPAISGNLQNEKVDLEQKLANTYESIRQVREKLSADKALIGFSGAPWTLACYIFGDKKIKNYYDVKKLAYNDDENFYRVFEILTIKVYEHLRNQIKSGADTIKIFDSWAGCLDQRFVHKLSLDPIFKIYKKLKEEFPAIRIIIFPKDMASHQLPLSPDCLALSYSENLEEITKKLDPNIVIQGNIDPLYLEIDNKALIAEEVSRIMNIMKNRKHIFNLGHGVNPTAKIENIQYIIDLVRRYNHE